MKPSYLPTQHQLPDVLTKILPSAKFTELLGKIGMNLRPPQFEGMGGFEIIYQRANTIRKGEAILVSKRQA